MVATSYIGIRQLTVSLVAADCHIVATSPIRTRILLQEGGVMPRVRANLGRGYLRTIDYKL